MSELPPASRRLCTVVDVEKYSGRGNVSQLAVQRNLREIAEAAVGHAGLPWRTVEVEDKGDGLLLQLPADIDEPRVIPALVTGFSLGLRHANTHSPASQRIRLRMALTQGIRHIGPTGRVGDAVIAACRLADCAELRAAFAPYGDRDLGLIVADDLFRDVIAHGYPGLAPAAFTMVKVRIPEKGFEELAWTFVPEPASGTLRPAPKGAGLARAAASAGTAVAGALGGGLIEAGLHHHADHEGADWPEPDWPDMGAEMPDATHTGPVEHDQPYHPDPVNPAPEDDHDEAGHTY